MRWIVSDRSADHRSERSKDALDRIIKTWGEILPVIEKMKPRTGKVVLRRHDEIVSAALETIRPHLLELLESAELPLDEKDKLRQDLLTTGPYLEPSGSFAFMAGTDVDPTDEAEVRNRGRLDLLAKLVAAVRARPVHEALPPAAKASAVKRRSPNAERDKWLYEQAYAGVPYKEIVNQLKRIATVKGWSLISSIQGVRDRAKAHARRNKKKPLPPRQGK